MFSNLKTVDPNMNLRHVFSRSSYCYAKHNAHTTINSTVKLFMSNVYNESCLKKEISLFHGFFSWTCTINYANYKSSHAMFYDLVSAHRLVVLKLKGDSPHTSCR